MTYLKNKFLLGTIAVALLIAGFVVFSQKKNPSTAPDSSTSNITFTKPTVSKTPSISATNQTNQSSPTAITAAQTSSVISRALSTNGTNGIAYTVAAQTQPLTGWVVFTITYPEFPDAREQVIARQDNKGTLTYVAGPAAPFPIDTLKKLNIPTEVINAVSYENDDL